MTALNDVKESIIGDDNDKHIKLSIEKAHKLVLAWGNALAEKKVKVHSDRVGEVIKLIGNMPLYCIELTGKGCPKHPLYCKTSDEPTEIIWNGERFIMKNRPEKR